MKIRLKKIKAGHYTFTHKGIPGTFEMKKRTGMKGKVFWTIKNNSMPFEFIDSHDTLGQCREEIEDCIKHFLHIDDSVIAPVEKIEDGLYKYTHTDCPINFYIEENLDGFSVLSGKDHVCDCKTFLEAEDRVNDELVKELCKDIRHYNVHLDCKKTPGNLYWNDGKHTFHVYRVLGGYAITLPGGKVESRPTLNCVRYALHNMSFPSWKKEKEAEEKTQKEEKNKADIQDCIEKIKDIIQGNATSEIDALERQVKILRILASI